MLGKLERRSYSQQQKEESCMVRRKKLSQSPPCWVQFWSSLSQLSTDNETEEKMYDRQADLGVSNEAAAVVISAHQSYTGPD